MAVVARLKRSRAGLPTLYLDQAVSLGPKVTNTTANGHHTMAMLSASPYTYGCQPSWVTLTRQVRFATPSANGLPSILAPECGLSPQAVEPSSAIRALVEPLRPVIAPPDTLASVGTVSYWNAHGAVAQLVRAADS